MSYSQQILSPPVSMWWRGTEIACTQPWLQNLPYYSQIIPDGMEDLLFSKWFLNIVLSPTCIILPHQLLGRKPGKTSWKWSSGYKWPPVSLLLVKALWLMVTTFQGLWGDPPVMHLVLGSTASVRCSNWSSLSVPLRRARWPPGSNGSGF